MGKNFIIISIISYFFIKVDVNLIKYFPSESILIKKRFTKNILLQIQEK